MDYSNEIERIRAEKARLKREIRKSRKRIARIKLEATLSVAIETLKQMRRAALNRWNPLMNTWHAGRSLANYKANALPSTSSTGKCFVRSYLRLARPESNPRRTIPIYEKHSSSKPNLWGGHLPTTHNTHIRM